MTTQIRTLVPDDAPQLLKLLREAVTDAPLAFVTAIDDDIASSVALVREELARAPDTVVFGAFDDGMIGMLWFGRETRTKRRHKALIWRTFVQRPYRGCGVGRDLLQAAIAHAHTVKELTTLYLGVSGKSPNARRLYESFGFTVWGTEPDSIRHDGESTELYYMQLMLR